MDDLQGKGLIRLDTRVNLLANRIVLVAPKDSAKPVAIAPGIVYATDAAADPSVTVVGTFPPVTHPPIVYPVAVTKDATNGEAAAFLAYLRCPAAKAAFERQGFAVLKRSATGS